MKIKDMPLRVLFLISSVITIISPYFPWYEITTNGSAPGIFNVVSSNETDSFRTPYGDTPAFPEIFDIYKSFKNTSSSLLFYIGLTDLLEIFIVFAPIVLSLPIAIAKKRKPLRKTGEKGNFYRYAVKKISVTERLVIGCIRLYPSIPLITGTGLILRTVLYGKNAVTAEITPFFTAFIIFMTISVILVRPVFYKGGSIPNSARKKKNTVRNGIPEEIWK